jgi:hypothetical protein
MQPTFEEIVRAWLLHYDDRLPSDRRERREAFIVLLGNLQDHGYSKEEITSSRREKIIRSCVNPFHNKQKLKKWVSLLVNDLEAAVLIFYPTIKIRDDVVTSDMIAKLDSMTQRAEESRALRTVSNGEEGSDSEFNLLELSNSDKLDIPEAIKNEPKVKDFAITDDMLDEMEAPEVIWDEDFYKKMGLE